MIFSIIISILMFLVYGLPFLIVGIANLIKRDDDKITTIIEIILGVMFTSYSILICFFGV